MSSKMQCKYKVIITFSGTDRLHNGHFEHIVGQESDGGGMYLKNGRQDLEWYFSNKTKAKSIYAKLSKSRRGQRRIELWRVTDNKEVLLNISGYQSNIVISGYKRMGVLFQH